MRSQEREPFSLRFDLGWKRLNLKVAKTQKVVLILYHLHDYDQNYFSLEPVCCKKQQKSPWPVTDLGKRGLLKDLNNSKLIAYQSK